MRLLELFSGTGSVGTVFKNAGWDVVSVDCEKKFAPTICCDILQIPLDKWQPGYFDYVHASVPCCEYSMAHTRNARDLAKGDELALYTLSLIRTLNPQFWTLENPATSLLKTRDFMQDIPFSDCAYCMYSDWGYRKRTRFWHNIPGWEPKNCENCPNMVPNTKTHRTSAQKGPCRGKPSDVCYTSEQLYRIPPLLVESILGAILVGISPRSN
jgi:hypothetical protein